MSLNVSAPPVRYANCDCNTDHVLRPFSILTQFLSRTVILFFVLLSVCLLHRAIAVWRYYKASLNAVYMPEDTSQGAEMLWAAHGESLLSGVGADVMFSLVAAAFLALPVVRSWLRVGIIVLLVFFLSANQEHIFYNFTHINLGTAQNALDMTFIRGQLTDSFGKTIFVMLAGAVLSYGLLTISVLHRLGGVLMIAFSALSLLSSSGFSFTQPGWMQTHPLLPNLAADSVPESTRTFSDSPFAATATPPVTAPGYNVLLIYMEGLSQKSLELGNMTTLQALAEENITFKRYLGNQIVTANGLYTTMTGDLPYFLSKALKWDALQPEATVARNALPAQMRRAGYHTAFLQSAHLEYMNKGKVLPILGFSETRGRADWDHAYATDGWGIDDRALFEHTLDYLTALRQDQPWFVSVLTTGTHSPYNVPADFMPDAASDRTRALAYLDLAIAELLKGLSTQGLLDNTVVIFTSDESRENAFEHPLADQLILNWLPLIIRHPSGLQETLTFYIDSQRLPEIITRLATDTTPESLANLEQPQKSFVMGNVYANRLFWFEPDEQVLFACNTQNFLCAKFSGVSDPMTISEVAPDETAYYPSLERNLASQETNH